MTSNTYEWSEADLQTLKELEAANEALPISAPRALLSVRLSVFTDDTTSPARQEIDLRRLALERQMRVVGVASDLGVSALKVPPWKRKSLGDWLNNRLPEFDAILFWKLDRFIRNITDLSVMIRWAEQYKKNLISKHDPIDLSTTMGKLMVTFIGAVAEIEAANTSTRVQSLWAYAKTQEEWIVGKPPFGYEAYRDEGDKKRLRPRADQLAQLEYAAKRLTEDQSVSIRQVIRELQEKELANKSLTVATLARRLRNPGIMGYRVEEAKNGGYRRSQLVYDAEGKPIRVGPPLFSQEQFDELQKALDLREKKQPARNPGGATKFRGILKCSDCNGNMLVQQFTNKHGTYAYLRCQGCKSGGMGAPHPQEVYDRLVTMVLKFLGNRPVETREYARGEDVRKRVADLQERIAYYMSGLEPGGRLTKTKFTQDQAEEALDKLIAELEQINPETLEDRWMIVPTGKTFREHWEEGGEFAMAEDLRRAGITCTVFRTKIPRQRAPKVELKLNMPEPEDLNKNLVVLTDSFENPL